MKISSAKHRFYTNKDLIQGKEMLQSGNVAIGKDAFSNNPPEQVSIYLHQSLAELPIKTALTLWYLDYFREAMAILTQNKNKYRDILINKPTLFKFKSDDVKNSNLKFQLDMSLDWFLLEMSVFVEDFPDKPIDEMIFEKMMDIMS